MSQPDIPAGRAGGPESEPDRAREIAQSTRDEVAHVADEARGHARELARHARTELRQQADRQTDNVADGLGRLGSQMHALAEGRADEAGAASDYAERLASQADELSGRIRGLGFDGVVEEVQHFARRRPGLFLLGTAAAGFAVTRLTRAARDERGESGQRSSSPALPADRAAGGPVPAPPPPPVVTPPQPVLGPHGEVGGT